MKPGWARHIHKHLHCKKERKKKEEKEGERKGERGGRKEERKAGKLACWESVLSPYPFLSPVVAASVRMVWSQVDISVCEPTWDPLLRMIYLICSMRENVKFPSVYQATLTVLPSFL